MYHFKLVILEFQIMSSNHISSSANASEILSFFSYPLNFVSYSLENSSNPICAELIFLQVCISRVYCWHTRGHIFKEFFRSHSQLLPIHIGSSARGGFFILTSLHAGMLSGLCLCMSHACCEKCCSNVKMFWYYQKSVSLESSITCGS